MSRKAALDVSAIGLWVRAAAPKLNGYTGALVYRMAGPEAP